MPRLTKCLFLPRNASDFANSFLMRGTSKKERLKRKEVLNRNRSDPKLERASRRMKLRVPLPTVKEDWKEEHGLVHLQRTGHHFNIFSDVYKQMFHPLGFMGVAYETNQIRHGNIVHPEKTLNEPVVSLPSSSVERNGYWTLVMSNPDGHLTDSNFELLHWMIGNIPAGEGIQSGDTLTPYLPPIPPQGTGVHRIIFSLFQHKETLSFESLKRTGSWLDERSFSTHQLLSSHPTLSPFTFCFFQTIWDQSVQKTYHNTLGMAEPVYGVEKTDTPRQSKMKLVKETRSQYYRDLIATCQTQPPQALQQQQQ
ncbi:PREDICTED: 39S ribosomal protein L38, mitochondrial-like [Amphimedon queenslandica]|uniref:Large ribosomal subunit protein mL38 n=1 Tax=Amphimedon queenslandica TaxID=400682 RepID=A0A1X7VW28_AMPQE|nr:PREDICTED: 39S ribosomal protein L38, mitochondrial-like [Amphimedon queenslandica]|eukprot:XP_011410353.2 PREDICTED: 39S ribosomal protein L38, mitochondrial-like [Amphimedon queenslandica]